MSPALAILGVTASGKSALAMTLSERYPDVELVSVDSMQVYRGMDIGTAKPTADERLRVRHHLIDLFEPDHEVTVVEFAAAYDDALAEIAARGHRAVLVGGTALYLRAVLDRLQPPGQWPQVRVELEADPDLAGRYAQLQRLDPVAAAKIDPGNRRRIVRALGVCLGSGRPFSSFGAGLDTYPPTDTPVVALRWSRPDIATRITQRIDTQLEAGWLGEARDLQARELSRTACQALGYGELFAHLRGELTMAAAREAIITRTRQFAVRQEKWFRRDPRIQWLDPHDDPLGSVQAYLEPT